MLRIGNHLHREMGLAIAQSTTYRRAHTRSLTWVQRVHIQAKMNGVMPSRNGDSSTQHFRDPKPINIRHGKDVHMVSAQQLLLSRIEITSANDDNVVGVQLRSPATNMCQEWIAQSGQSGKDHAMNIARWSCHLRIEVGMRIDPDDPNLAVHVGDPADRTECNTMIPSQDERELVRAQSIGYLLSQILGHLHDGFEVF